MRFDKRSTRYLFAALCLSCTNTPDEVPPDNLMEMPPEAPCAAAGISEKSRFPNGSPDGHADPLGAKAASQARASRISNAAWIRQPDNARQQIRLGDFLLINDKIAVYIEAPGVSDGYQSLGGDILAIEPVLNDGKPSGTSQYGETLLVFSRQSVGPETVSVLNDGSDGKDAVVRVNGRLRDVPYLESFAPLLGPSLDFPAAIDYVLSPGAERVKLRFSFMNPRKDDVDLSRSQYIGFFHDSRGQLFTPSQGFDNPQGSVEWIGWDTAGPASFAFRRLKGQFDYMLTQSGFSLFRSNGVVLPGCQKTTVDYAEFIVGGPGIDGLRAAIRRSDGGDSWRTVQGRVVTSDGTPVAGAMLHVLSASDQFLTRTVTDARGEYSVRAPKAAVKLQATREGYAPTPKQDLSATATSAELSLVKPGTIVVRTIDADSKQPLPVRIQIIPKTTVPFVPSSYGVEPEVNGRLYQEFAMAGEASFKVPPGEHRVVVSRGYEWELYDQPVMVTAGTEQNVNVSLAHSVDSTGVMCADFHIHSYYSADSNDVPEQKVKSAIADGLELPVSSEHEWILDFQPIIQKLGLTKWAFGVPSEEFTTFVWGHFGVVPIRPRPSEVNNGAVYWVGKKPPEVFANIAALPEQPVLIINHPRSASFGGGYFTAAEFNRATVTGDPELWSEQFGALEVFNNTDFESERNGMVKDWFAFLNAGKKRWAVGSSDSHSLRSEPVGYPRTCLYFGHDDPTKLSPELLRDSLRAGTGVVTGGLYMTVLGPGNELPGGTVTSAGDPTFRIVVQAPSWLMAKRLEVFVNGETERTIELQETRVGMARRYETTVTLKRPMGRPQNWVVFYANSDGRDLSPVHPRRKPFAVSNPIFF